MAQSVNIDLVAKSIAFNKTSIAVPKSARVNVNFDNQDNGVPHNFAVYKTAEAKENFFKGDIIKGPSKITYVFTAPDTAGTYFFRCDVHPMMNGDFIVE